jgi:hypothetical protein
MFTSHFSRPVLFIHKAARADCSWCLVMLFLFYHNFMLQTISPAQTRVLSPSFSRFFEFIIIDKDSSMTYVTPIVLSSVNIYYQINFHDQYFIQFQT